MTSQGVKTSFKESRQDTNLHSELNSKFEEEKWKEEKAVLEDIKVSLQESMDEEEKITEEIDDDMKRMVKNMNTLEAELYPHDPGPEGEGKKSSIEDGWQKRCNLPRGWMSKVKQHKFRKTGVQGKQEFRKTGGPLMWKSPVRMMAGKRAATGSENG